MKVRFIFIGRYIQLYQGARKLIL